MAETRLMAACAARAWALGVALLWGGAVAAADEVPEVAEEVTEVAAPDEVAAPVTAPSAPAAVEAAAGSQPPCGIDAGLLQQNPPLPRVAHALAAGRLHVVVLGTGSTGGAGTSDRALSYPQRLRERLQARYPEVELRLDVLVRPGQTATQMQREFVRGGPTATADLVIWQSGSVDAVRQAPLQHYGQAVSRGVAHLRRSGADVLLMDMQYGPYAELVANFRPYQGYLWWASRELGVGLVPRYQMMEAWSAEGRFDFASDDPQQQRATADAVHACLGGVLDWMIADGVGQARRPASSAEER